MALNKNEKLFMILIWTSVIVWLSIIFIFSSQPAAQSNGLSKKVTGVIVEKVSKIASVEIDSKSRVDLISKFNNIVRKLAHFGLYFVLGILVVNALNQSKVKGSRDIVFSILFCILYAVSDELHQIYVPGRGAQVRDVIIDSIGGLFGIIFYKLASKNLDHIKKRRKYKKI